VIGGEGRRPERVAHSVLREVSALLLRAIKDPRLKGVTLTEVRVTDDLRRAQVFFSHLEGAQRANQAAAGFESARGFIRRHLVRALGLRHPLEVAFEFDASGERAARIDRLLRQQQPKEPPA
jgi:ribosome-binding factor A